ncbi:sigma-54-dependent Fis family transcriptional regulator [uncultured Desulfovibrio sp.]|uniref:sigma-54 interaction domain-containing protein n=1 Tax=uncultured Desulfovibrio sp. TaxID=167968 RepID=UPI00263AB038|nr:sigma 54-interacting transcriptional regulator [uncultured Desulfovibrio sp.]
MQSDQRQQTLAAELARFKAGEAAAPPGVREEIRASWLRCRKRWSGGEPGGRPARSHPHVLSEVIMRTASPILDEYGSPVAESGGALLLVDPDGFLLRVAGAPDLMDDLGLRPGMELSENGIGTSATGLCLVGRQPCRVLGAEHYARALHGLAACAAPLSGGKFRFFGVLAAVFPLGRWNAACGALLDSLAANINHAHHINDLLKDQETTLELLNESVLILNSEAYIKAANAHARRLLNIGGAEKIALGHIGNFVRDGAPFQEIIENGRRVVDRECSLDIGGEVKRVLLSAEFIPEGKGIVCTLTEMERVERLAARSTSGKAIYRFSDIIGASDAIVHAVDLARMAAQSDITTLLLGESGTGKELFAHAVHNGSARRRGPFVTINCGALPRELVQSELFGYEPGAFTGAVKNGKAGKFELADKGTIFLDEIGEMPFDAQTNLLRLIQNREVSRLGSTASRTVDVRIIAATNRNLQTAMESGTFRSDLYYRLCVFAINVPSLRSRPTDIGVLAEHFRERYVARLGRRIRGFTHEAMQLLLRYAWPGNIRELENVVEYAVNICAGPYIQAGDLPVTVSGAVGTPLRPQQMPSPAAPSVEAPTLYQLERNAIVEVLAHFNGNMSVAAEELGIARSALYSKLARFGIDHRSFRPQRK